MGKVNMSRIQVFYITGPDMESKATGYTSSEKEERERSHGAEPVQERESYSSSRYTLG